MGQLLSFAPTSCSSPPPVGGEILIHDQGNVLQHGREITDDGQLQTDSAHLPIGFPHGRALVYWRGIFHAAGQSISGLLSGEESVTDHFTHDPFYSLQAVVIFVNLPGEMRYVTSQPVSAAYLASPGVTVKRQPGGRAEVTLRPTGGHACGMVFFGAQ